MEIDVIGYDGRYTVTSDGEVYSTSYMNRGFKKVLSKNKNNKGYYRVSLMCKPVCVHRIVAVAFVPNPEGYEQVNHKNGDKTDNRSDNLEWCTNTHNRSHATDLGLLVNPPVHCGEAHPQSKLKQTEVDDIRIMLIEGNRARDIARKYNIDVSLVYLIKNNKIWK